MPPSRPLALMLALPLLGLVGGCVSHVARVENPAPATTWGVIGEEAVDELPLHAERTSPLPIDLRVSAWRRTEEGELLRSESRLRTPLPWWQRFPADIVTDALLPGEHVAGASQTLLFHPVPVSDADQLLAAARRDGYARRAASPTSAGDGTRAAPATR